jgi:hypothetical protein
MSAGSALATTCSRPSSYTGMWSNTGFTARTVAYGKYENGGSVQSCDGQTVFNYPIDASQSISYVCKMAA